MHSQFCANILARASSDSSTLFIRQYRIFNTTVEKRRALYSYVQHSFSLFYAHAPRVRRFLCTPVESNVVGIFFTKYATKIIVLSHSVATDHGLFSCLTYNSCDNTKGNNRGCYLSSSRDGRPRYREINAVNQDFIFAGRKNGRKRCTRTRASLFADYMAEKQMFGPSALIKR